MNPHCPQCQVLIESEQRLMKERDALRAALENIAAQGQFALNKNELRAFEICAGLAEEALK